MKLCNTWEMSHDCWNQIKMCFFRGCLKLAHQDLSSTAGHELKVLTKALKSNKENLKMQLRLSPAGPLNKKGCERNK